MRRRPAALALWALACLAACAREPRPNFLVVVIDTLRADRLGCYGNTRGLTPFLDSLAGRGVLFRHAYAQSPWTNPSVASLLTSRYQSQHRMLALNSVLADAEVTLPEVLRAAGYATAGFSANYLIGPGAGFHQGFDEYRAYAPRPIEGQARAFGLPERSDFIAGKALEWLEGVRRSKKPWFLYLQLMEPHNPYRPIPAMLERLRGERPMPDVGAVNWHLFEGREQPLSEAVLADIRDVYDAEVASVDFHLRAFFAQLGVRGLLERTIVVVTADHGEELKDHGLIGHDHTLYEEVVRVPLIVSVPGDVRAREVTATASLVDLAPTLLELAGVAAPPSFEGRSLAPWLTGERTRAAAARAETWPAFSELLKPPDREGRRLTPHQRAIIVPPHKMIAGVGGERFFFDLHADPAETNGDALDAGLRARLESEMGAFERRYAGSPRPAPQRTIGEEEREKMRRLGYE